LLDVRCVDIRAAVEIDDKNHCFGKPGVGGFIIIGNVIGITVAFRAADERVFNFLNSEEFDFLFYNYFLL
jgi:hypothetical protein